MQHYRTIDGIKCLFDDNGVTIKESYRIRYEDVADFCIKMKKKLPRKYKRSAESWTREVIAHNILYKHNMLKIHTIDADLDEDEKIWKLICYSILYFAYRIKSLFLSRK